MHALILRCCISHLIPNRNLLHSLRSFHCRQQHHHHHHSCALNRINSSHMHIKYTFFVRTKCTLRIHVRRASHVSGACRFLCVCVCICKFKQIRFSPARNDSIMIFAMHKSGTIENTSESGNNTKCKIRILPWQWFGKWSRMRGYAKSGEMKCLLKQKFNVERTYRRMTMCVMHDTRLCLHWNNIRVDCTACQRAPTCNSTDDRSADIRQNLPFFLSFVFCIWSRG